MSQIEAAEAAYRQIAKEEGVFDHAMTEPKITLTKADIERIRTAECIEPEEFEALCTLALQAEALEQQLSTAREDALEEAAKKVEAIEAMHREFEADAKNRGRLEDAQIADDQAKAMPFVAAAIRSLGEKE